MRFFTIGLILMLFLINPVAMAQKQNVKLWTANALQQPFPNNPRWQYALFIRERFVNHMHAWQNSMIEGALNYSLTNNNALWTGYRWAVANPTTTAVQEYRLWQEVATKLRRTKNAVVFSRNRLEERKFSNMQPWVYRYRGRLSVERAFRTAGRINPLVYDEIFVQFERTDNHERSYFSENRLFFGFNWDFSKHEGLEFGYINQWLASTQGGQSSLDHILSFTLYRVG